jgi:hypothetical protein
MDLEGKQDCMGPPRASLPRSLLFREDDNVFDGSGAVASIYA